ncbi:hypothetical protein [Butyrivibrio sp. VCB2006]|uniref:hypothetical protein n=1 Tax=Butyrivibrio sp. VCB2006 TaxID=1280679 RepID=UPI0004174D2F|nr:hypothetical protein [Butyrivibrio sp. VCB2006]
MKNGKVLSAITIGITAMMALQTPISAYAAEPGALDPAPADPPQETQSQETAEETYVEVTTEAQDAADTAERACVVDDVQAQPEENNSGSEEQAPSAPEENTNTETTQTSEQGSSEQNGGQESSAEQQYTGPIAEKAVTDAASLILDGKEKTGVESATEIVSTQETVALENAADALINDKKDDQGNVIQESAVSHYEDAAQDIANAKQDLEQAEEINKAADASYKEANEAVKEAADKLEGDFGLQKTADNIEGTVNDASTKAHELVDRIINAKNEQEAKKALEDLDTLLAGSTQTLTGQTTQYETLSGQYQDAVNKLEQAQQNLANQEAAFGTELGQASSKTKAAQEEVEQAQKLVNELADALKDADDAVPDQANQGAENLSATRDEKGTDWDGWFGGNGSKDFETSREGMKRVIIDYYMPVIKGIDIITDDEAYAPKFETKQALNSDYESRYTSLTYWYYDENGTPQQDVKYFNWDSIAKTDYDNQNLKANQSQGEATAGIVFYEKTEAEVNPSKAINDIAASRIQELNHADYQLNDDFIWGSEKNIKKASDQKLNRLYSYTDENGETKYITQAELFGTYPGLKNVTYLASDKNNLLDNAKNSPDHVYVSTLKNLKFTYVEEDNVLITPTGSYKNLQEVTTTNFVTQNQNGLYKNADCYIIGDTQKVSDALKGENGYSFVYENVIQAYGIDDSVIDKLIADNKAMNDYITVNSTSNLTAIKAQYDAYDNVVKAADEAAKNAVDQVEKLDKAINELGTASSNFRKMLSAKDLLGLENVSVAQYLGLTDLSEEDAAALDNLDINGLKAKLQELKEKADQKVENAKTLYEQVKAQKDKAQEELDNAIDRINKAGGNVGGGLNTEPDPEGGTGGQGGGTAGEGAVRGTAVTPTGTATGAVAPTAATAATQTAATQTAAGQTIAPDAATTIADAPAAQAGTFVATAAQGGNGEFSETLVLDDGTEQIADEQAPTAATPGNAPILQENDDTQVITPEAEVANIIDDNVAKADTIPDATQHMNWWWLLIIAVLGATGKKMYDEHMKKKEEKERTTD